MKNTYTMFALGILILGITALAVGCGSSGTSSSNNSYNPVSNSTTTLKVTNVNPYSISAQTALAQTTLPASLELNVTFDRIQISADNVTYYDLVRTPFTVNLLDQNTQTENGSTAEVLAPASNTTYRYLKMAIGAVYLSMPGQSNRDLLSEMQQENPNEDWDNMLVEIFPFTYSSGDLRLNMYFPPANISGNSYSSYQAINGPNFKFTGGSVVQSSVEQVYITIASPKGSEPAITQEGYAYITANKSLAEGQPPSFTAPLSIEADGSVNGYIVLPEDTWYLFAQISTQEITTMSSTTEFNLYTPSGESFANVAPLTIEAGATYEVTLQYVANPYEGPQGSPEAAQNQASLRLTLTTESVVSLEAGAQILIFSATTESGIYDSIKRDVLSQTSVEGDTLQSYTYTATELLSGTYYIYCFLDINGNSLMDAGTDYLSPYQDYQSIEAITLTDNATTDITSNPIELQLYQLGQQ